MSRRSLKPTRAASSSDEEFVMVPPKGTPSPAPAAAAAASAADAPSMSLDEALRNRVKGTPEEEEAYEAALDKVDRAAWLGIALPPVAPPGHHLVPQTEPSKPPTLWTLLFKRAENKSTLQQLYFTTVLMVVIPLGLMALTFYTVFSGLSEESRLMYSGFAGVLGVNIVALGFGLFAYLDNGGDDDEEQEAMDEAAEADAKKAKWEAWEKAQEENESREDKERLQILREKHAEKQGRKLPKESATTEAAAAAVEEEQETASVASRTRTRSRSRGRPAKKDSALAAADETVATPSRSTRSKKA